MRPRLTADEITALCDAHHAPLLFYARHWNDAGAEDIVQGAFLALVKENLERGKPDNPVSWLYKVVRNQAISLWRAESRRKNREESAAQTMVSFEAAGPSILEAREVADSFERLEPDRREIVFLRIWAGLAFDEIAKTTEKSRSTVYRLYRDGLETMKKELTK